MRTNDPFHIHGEVEGPRKAPDSPLGGLVEAQAMALGAAQLEEQKAENAFGAGGRLPNRRAQHAAIKAAWKAYDDATTAIAETLGRLSVIAEERWPSVYSKWTRVCQSAESERVRANLAEDRAAQAEADLVLATGTLKLIRDGREIYIRETRSTEMVDLDGGEASELARDTLAKLGAAP